MIDSLLVTPAVDGADGEFARQVADFIDAYRPAMKALAQKTI